MREGFSDLLEKFHALGLRQHVLSATEINMLCRQLTDFGIIDAFDSIHGLDNIHAHSKTQLAVKFKQENENAKVLFIGDTDHDYDTAMAMGADCALVCGGHSTKKKLLSCKGAQVYNSFEELYDKLTKKS